LSVVRERFQRAIARHVLPRARLFARRLAGGPQRLQGRFSSWQDACRESTGYDQPAIVERLIEAAEVVIGGGGQKFERDGVVFAEPITPFPLLTFLLIASGRSSNRLTVLDFGGSLGSTYRQCQPFLAHLSFLRWSIVEQAHIAVIGKSRFENDVLRFYSSISEAFAVDHPDVVILSSVLQYLEDPYKTLASVVAFKPSLIIIDRNPYSEMNSDTFSLQIVTDAIFPARLPFRIFGDNSIENRLAPAYRKVAEFDAVDTDMMAGSLVVRFRGKAFERAVNEREG
jgi:putative methyltransferase (TIGR04325 family)